MTVKDEVGADVYQLEFRTKAFSWQAMVSSIATERDASAAPPVRVRMSRFEAMPRPSSACTLNSWFGAKRSLWARRLSPRRSTGFRNVGKIADYTKDNRRFSRHRPRSRCGLIARAKETDNGIEELQNPVDKYPKPPYKKQSQPWPGLASKMDPPPDHGETSYKGSGRLAGRKALITGGDSGMGRAAAIAYAREGADVAINYFPTEEPDAKEVIDLIKAEGRIGRRHPGRLAGREILPGTRRSARSRDSAVWTFWSATPGANKRTPQSSTSPPRISMRR